MLKAEKIYYGGDYNPDQWDEATIAEDMRLFRKAGINLLTLPVFSWAKLEPDEGVYDFGWLDRIIDQIWANGIHVCLATPTTAQPAWLSTRYPEVLPVDIQGRKRTHGKPHRHKPRYNAFDYQQNYHNRKPEHSRVSRNKKHSMQSPLGKYYIRCNVFMQAFLPNMRLLQPVLSVRIARSYVTNTKNAAEP